MIKQHKLYFAVSDKDYQAGPYDVTFTAGKTMAQFDVVINDDNILENNESFTLKIDVASLPDMVTLGTINEVMVFILNDDSKLIHELKYNQYF